MKAQSDLHAIWRALKPMGVFFSLLLTVYLLMACSGGAPTEAALGEPAPGFSLPTSDGATVSLDDYVGQKPVLLYFHMAVG